jgi:hypothetical protein
MNNKRLAVLLKPGNYPDLAIEVGYYSTVAGLGAVPSDVKVKVVGTSVFDSSGHHTNSFWRTIENLEVYGAMNWFVSQATSLRSVIVNGDLVLGAGGYASGGYVANSLIRGSIDSHGQQQWFSRNTKLNRWSSTPNINNVQVGNQGELGWKPTVIEKTLVIAEKPFLVYSGGGFSIHSPPKRTDSMGPDISPAQERFSVTEEMLVNPSDTAATIMSTLSQQSEQNGWKALVFLPGEYDQLGGTVIVNTQSNVVLIGLGMATLISHEFGPCLKILDKGSEIRVASLMFHQGTGTNAKSLIQFGEDSASAARAVDHRIFFYDIICRTGGPRTNNGIVNVMMQVNTPGVVGDNSWLWTGDHGDADANGNAYWARNNGQFVSWYAQHGLIVDAPDYVQYALMSEHHKDHMAWFRADGAKIYFYQSELPYAQFDTTKFAYKVEDYVTEHQAYGIGCYVIFKRHPLDPSKPNYDAAMSVPAASGIHVHELIAAAFNGGGIRHALKFGDQFKGGISNTGSRIEVVNYP